ncbi:MAG: hypothetical protein M0R66_02455 [Candidatus Omnitrophica bacterium]|jgi:hypothetical protein|nr:hypothetical protein [Sphaerochaeta sp.]MCK9603229.1 hypothetical protein [Candidatus Omnitrophota bacterium]
MARGPGRVDDCEYEIGFVCPDEDCGFDGDVLASRFDGELFYACPWCGGDHEHVAVDDEIDRAYDQEKESRGYWE